MTKLFITITAAIIISGGIGGCSTDELGQGVYSQHAEVESRYRIERFNRRYYRGHSTYRGYSGYRGYRHHGFGHYRSRHHSYGGYSRHGYRGYRRRY